MDPSSINVPIVVGTVHELPKNYKGIVKFECDGSTQYALLSSRSMVCDGSLLHEDKDLNEYLTVGSEVIMRVYPFKENHLKEMCKFLVLAAWKREDIDIPRDSSVQVFHGFCSQPCFFSHHGETFEVASCKDNPDSLIAFHKSDVYILGERSKEWFILKRNIEMQCDCIPCNVDSFEGTEWKALVLWRGKRPSAKEIKGFKYNKDDMLDNIKQLTQNSRSIFLRTTGQVIKLLNQEYGIALAMIRTNEWHSVLFHTSSSYLNETVLDKAINLKAVFQPGDKVNILAAKAPKILKFDWVASVISPLIN